MGFMTELRYKRDDLNDKLKEAPWWVWVVIGGVLILIMLVPLTCTLRDPPRITQEQARMEEARGHLAQAFSEVITRLAEQVEAKQRPDLQQAVSAIASEKGADFFRSPITGDAYRLNPDVRAWMVNVSEQPPPGVSTTDVLIVTKATPDLEKTGLVYIGLRPRRIPANLKAGEDPAWLGEALVPAG